MLPVRLMDLSSRGDQAASKMKLIYPNWIQCMPTTTKLAQLPMQMLKICPYPDARSLVAHLGMPFL